MRVKPYFAFRKRLCEDSKFIKAQETMIMKTALRRITLWFLVVTALFGASFKQVDAGDFMLIAASENHTIFAGSMSKALDDLTALPLKGVELPQAVDYDPAENMVYWTHYHDGPAIGKLSRAHLNGTNQMTLLSDIQVAFGLALDLVTRLAYWTDHTLGQIGRVPMDGSGAKEIIVEGLGDPRGIAIDHGQGHIYWTDVGNEIIHPKIERANLDGTNRITLVANNLVFPQAVIIYQEANYLYWCDGILNKIERSNLLGNNREIVINLNKYEPIHPFDLAIYNDYIYWSGVFYGGISRVKLNGRGEHNYSPSIFPEIRRIHIATEPNYCDSSPCHNGATCEDIVNGFVCHCLSSFSGVTCSENESSLPVVPIAAGGAVAAIVIVLLIIVIVVVKMNKKQRNDQERVVNVPPVMYQSRTPPPAYQFDRSTYVWQTGAEGGINNPVYNK